MASRKNRSGKANRRSPRSPPPSSGRLAQRLEALGGWLRARRWYAFVLGAALLFGASLVGGYWLLTDGLNGVWIARLIRRSDETARIASRVMTLAVSGISLLTAAVGVALQLVPGLDTRIDDHLWLLSVCILAVILGSFMTGKRLARHANLRAQMAQA